MKVFKKLALTGLAAFNIAALAVLMSAGDARAFGVDDCDEADPSVQGCDCILEAVPPWAT